MRDRLGVPALGEHADGDDVLNLLAGLSHLAHCVHLPAKESRLLRLGQLTLERRVLLAPVTLRLLVGRVDDQAVDGILACHGFGST